MAPTVSNGDSRVHPCPVTAAPRQQVQPSCAGQCTQGPQLCARSSVTICIVVASRAQLIEGACVCPCPAMLTPLLSLPLQGCVQGTVWHAHGQDRHRTTWDDATHVPAPRVGLHALLAPPGHVPLDGQGQRTTFIRCFPPPTPSQPRTRSCSHSRAFTVCFLGPAVTPRCFRACRTMDSPVGQCWWTTLC